LFVKETNMGLDMYLNAKRFMWHTEGELAETVAQVFPEIKGRRVKQVIVEAMYWRKSNAIHKWFVDNVQEGTDDCGDYWVSREQLEALRQLILKVLDTKDARGLPPQEGFFFGSTDVDDYYWQDLRRTADELEKVLEEFPESWDFEYHSSW
jgi:hypothetical protein